MASHGSRVHIELPNIHLAWNPDKIAKGGFSTTTPEGIQLLNKKPYTKVQEENKWAVELPGPRTVKTAIEKHLAMVPANHVDGCRRQDHGTACTLLTCWQCNGTGAHPPEPEPRPLECHPCPLVPIKELKVLKSKVCHLDMCKYILHFPTLNYSVLTHLRMIANAIMGIFQLC
jgi:hypothetical protein